MPGKRGPASGTGREIDNQTASGLFPRTINTYAPAAERQPGCGRGRRRRLRRSVKDERCPGAAYLSPLALRAVAPRAEYLRAAGGCKWETTRTAYAAIENHRWFRRFPPC